MLYCSIYIVFSLRPMHSAADTTAASVIDPWIIIIFIGAPAIQHNWK